MESVVLLDTINPIDVNIVKSIDRISYKNTPAITSVHFLSLQLIGSVKIGYVCCCLAPYFVGTMDAVNFWRTLVLYAGSVLVCVSHDLGS